VLNEETINGHGPKDNRQLAIDNWQYAIGNKQSAYAKAPADEAGKE